MFDFEKSVLVGLYQAFKSDIDVFLIGCAGIALAHRLTKGLGVAILFYVSMRRADSLMSAYINLQQTLRPNNE